MVILFPQWCIPINTPLCSRTTNVCVLWNWYWNCYLRIWSLPVLFSPPFPILFPYYSHLYYKQWKREKKWESRGCIKKGVMLFFYFCCISLSLTFFSLFSSSLLSVARTFGSFQFPVMDGAFLSITDEGMHRER